MRLFASGWPGAGIRPNPRFVARLVLALLVVANLVAATVMLKPWEGSADSLARRAASLRQELKQKQAAVERMRGIVSKVQTARSDGDTFMKLVPAGPPDGVLQPAR